MDVVGALRRAVEAVDEADIPAELRPVAFAKAFERLCYASSNHGGSYETVRQPVASAGAGGLELIASRLGLPLAMVERAYVLEGDHLELVVLARKLDAAKSRATEQIAILVAAGRQAVGIDEDGWTAVDRIREACENYKRYDSSNFATTIRGMDDLFTVRGTGRSRKVRMSAPAWQRAAEVLSGVVDSA